MLAEVLLVHLVVALEPSEVGIRCYGRQVLANTTSGVNVSVDSAIYRYKFDCALAVELEKRMPELCLEFFTLTDATGVEGGWWDVQNAYFTSMMNNLKQHDRTVEIFRMPGMDGLAEHLLPIDEATVNTKEKYLMRNKAGQVVAFSDTATQYVLFYRDDILARHNLTTTANGWDEFEETMLLLQERERAYRRECCEKDNGACSCGDPEDFYALATEHFQHVTQQERWLRSSYLTDFFATLLSGNSGGTIMDNDGNVTVNNPQAVKTLKMWKRWYETIVHPSNTNADTMVYKGRVGVALEQNYRIQYIKTPYPSISLRPIPGPTGVGGTDLRMLAVSKYVRHPEIALELMKLIDPSQETVQKYTSHPPVDKRVVNGTTQYDEWCSYRYKFITCQSYEMYPDFWQRPFVSIGQHCGEKKLACTGVVYNLVIQSLKGEIEPEDAVEQMAGSLSDISSQPATTSSDSMWTGEFTFLVVVAVVGSVAFFALMFLAWGLVRPLRSSGTLVLPLPVVLSLCMMVILGVEIGVATNYSSNTSKDISRSLALQLRTETLATVKNAVIPQLENAAGSSDEQKGKLARMQAGLAVSVGLLKLQKGVLVAVVNRADGTVLGSSNEWVQRVGASLVPASGEELPQTSARTGTVLQQDVAPPVPISPWMAAVPVAVPNWQNATLVVPSDSYSISVGGETVHFSIQVITHKGLDLLVVYFVPEEVILGKANDDVEKLIYMSAGLAVLAVVAVAAVAVVSTLPLVTLSRDMEAVRVMRVEEVMSGKGSRLAEMNALLLGFHGMVDMLIEYKSYMPKTLFMKEDESDEIDSTSEKKSETPSASGGTSKSTRASISTPSVVESVGHGPQLDKLNVSEGCVVRVRVVGLHEMLEKTTRASNIFMDMLSAVEQVSETYRACLHTFNAVEPGDFVLSWGVVSGGIPHREKAARAALHLAEGRHVLAVTYVNGQCKSGNLGTSKTRGFGIVGRVMEECGRVSRTALEMATTLGKSVVLCNEGVQKRMTSEIQVELVDLLGGRSALRRVYRVLRIREMDCQEWMYELEEQERAAKHPATLCLEEVAKGRDLNAALAVLTDVPKVRDDFGLNTLIAARLEEIKGMKINVLSVPSLFMQTSFVPHIAK